jgi:hypothetical protein
MRDNGIMIKLTV